MLVGELKGRLGEKGRSKKGLWVSCEMFGRYLKDRKREVVDRVFKKVGGVFNNNNTIISSSNSNSSKGQ